MLLQTTLSGLATGAIYALLALSVVLVYQTSRQINLAQGEIAMLTTFMAWQLLQWGLPYWLTFAAIIVVAFFIGAGLRQFLIAPLVAHPPRFQLGAMAGLFLLFNSVAGFVWGQDRKAFPSPFGIDSAFGSTPISGHRAGMIAAAVLLMLALYFFFARTRTGLWLRGAADNSVSARMVGIRVERGQIIAWGLAAVLGAVAGMLIAPVVLLDPQMMLIVFPYAVAAAVFGGLGNPIGAVVAGLAIGVIEALSTAYLPVVGRELKLAIALAVIFLVLIFRPQGLFGDRSAEGA